MNKTYWPWVFLLAIVLAVTALVRHFHIRNFHVVRQEVLYASGQPRGMDYTRLLYRYHIATIVNIRSADEHREKNWYNEEITWIRNNGVNYIELPIPKRPGYFPDEQTQSRFLEIMADKTKLPVLLHCDSGRKRTPMLTAVWLIKAEDFSIDDAIEVVEKLNDEPVTDIEKKFLSSLP
ncbi:MAG: dual specificity protein phosphatase family protein [Planctomycetota bacterium]